MDKKLNQNYFTRHPVQKDTFSFIGFALLVIIGTLFINTFIFRSFLVNGHSMDSTLADGDRLIVNRLPVTQAQMANKTYMPHRGQIIVFKNPRFVQGAPDEYIVKRVIAFPGERVTVIDGVLTVYNDIHPEGFHPDDDYRKGTVGPKSPVSGEVDTVVPDSTVFVCGDNRIANNSFDSRTGLGTIPTFDIIGPVSIRVFPFTSLTLF